MGGRTRNWSALTHAGYDLMLLQEVPPPPSDLDGHIIFEALDPPLKRGDRRGTGIWSRWPLELLTESRSHLGAAVVAQVATPEGSTGIRSHPGAAVVAEVATPEGSVTAYSLYARFEYVTYASNGRRGDYAVTTLHRVLSDLTVHLEDPARRGRAVLGGDFNCNPKWDLKSKHPTNRALLDRVEAYGLRSVLPINAHHQIPTFKKSQIDYLFVARGFEGGGRVNTDGPLAGLSDHHVVEADVRSVARG
jgi:endonuclease/exonuclease/phosphatase family metal-dependent hydrolase